MDYGKIWSIQPLSERRVILILFFFFFFFYLLFLGEYKSEAFYSSDEFFYFRLTQSITEDLSLQIEPYLGYDHSKYAPGQSVAGVPFYALSMTLLKIFPGFVFKGALILFFVHLTNVVIGGLICAAFYRFGRYLGYGRNASLAGALCLGLCTTFFVYAKQYLADPLAALFILCGVWALYDSGKNKPGSAVWAGAFFGMTLLTKIDSAFLILCLPLYLFFDRKNMKDRLLRFIPGFAPFFILMLLYNHFNYGDAFSPGYSRQGFASPFPSALFGLLFSPGRGLFLFTPPALLAIAGWKGFRRKHPQLFYLTMILAVVKIMVLAKWFSWQGGWCWGPRLLLPVLPLLLLPLFEIFETWRLRSPSLRITAAVLIIAGFVIQIAGSMVSPNKYPNDIWGMMQGNMNRFLFIPQLSHISGNLFLISQGKFDLGWLRFMNAVRGVAPFFFAVNLGIALFTGSVLLMETGMGRPGWFRRIFPEGKKILVPAIYVILIFAISGIILSGQGLNTMKYMYIEHDRKPDEIPTPHFFEGYIHAPVSGKLRFNIKIRGTYEILIDDEILAGTMRESPQRWEFAQMDLKKGLHRIEGRYVPLPGSDKAVMHVYWTIPDNAIHKNIIGPRHLYPEKPGALRKLLMLFVRFRAWFIIIGAAIIYLVLQKKEKEQAPSE